MPIFSTVLRGDNKFAPEFGLQFLSIARHPRFDFVHLSTRQVSLQPNVLEANMAQHGPTIQVTSGYSTLRGKDLKSIETWWSVFKGTRNEQ